ncbi:MAG: UxaA family hydrolase [Clostridia bacterium]|nr:UxaA family hydrolase [Clostridia bacterium]
MRSFGERIFRHWFALWRRICDLSIRQRKELVQEMIIHPEDNVEVNISDGQKYAARDIKKGEPIIKYGFPIGEALSDISRGEKVFPANIRSRLSGVCEWTYKPEKGSDIGVKCGSFQGFARKDGRVGIRNELWVVPTVGCINGVARTLAQAVQGKALTHPYGCSQLGEDHETTRKTLAALIRHPNAGGVLVLGLGCENNLIGGVREAVEAYGGEYDRGRIRYLNIQDCGDEIYEGVRILRELRGLMVEDKRSEQPISRLKIGVKCGGSDGYSGITANPLIGQVAERFALYGSSVLMTEIPEMFGAEEILLSRAKDKATFDRAADMINGFRRYYIEHGEKISENPSPGNIAGGISTLEEKSLGCVQKGGRVPLCGVGEQWEQVSSPGLNIVNGPGNDMVAVTNLMAAGANMILFSTGRGTPLSAPIPTLKISTNSALAVKKPHWIDYDAGRMLEDTPGVCHADRLFDLCISVASGATARGEENGYSDIAIFKNGVTL